jgi:UDP-N-acetylglucosamine--N-acetylmuramyl-(pentapeptide) pyrophosphoryl-undecaprenol N-acetylglucosamine transferase
MFRHRIVVTGGGTGGHIYPALAVCDILKDDPDLEALLYVGSQGHLEEKLVTERKISFFGVAIRGLPRKISLDLFSWILEFAQAVRQVRDLLRRYRPTVVLGTGGYASAPALVAALSLGVPISMHESDAHPGLVTKSLAQYATLISLGMDGALARIKKCRGKIFVNGNPVSQKFANPLRRDSAAAVLGLDPAAKTILITGGSQGAQAINEAVFGALPILLALNPPVQVVHQVGNKNYQAFRDRLPQDIANNKQYVLRAYFDDLSSVYAITDLAVCRSGAITIAELAVTGTPALFIPLPTAAANHQMMNARSVEAKGAAFVLPQDTLTGDVLAQKIASLIGKEDELKAMREKMHTIGKPRAAADLVDQIKEVSAAYQMRKQRDAQEASSA